MLEIVRKDYHTIYVTYSYDIYHVRMFEYERACSFSYVCLIFFSFFIGMLVFWRRFVYMLDTYSERK